MKYENNLLAKADVFEINEFLNEIGNDGNNSI